MITTFPTMSDALASGDFRPCHARYGDEDISGGSFFGYAYRARDGRESVTVRLTEEINKGGARGATVELMPLNPGVSAEDEADALRAAAMTTANRSKRRCRCGRWLVLMNSGEWRHITGGHVECKPATEED